MRRLTLLAALVLAVVLMAAVPVVASEVRATLEASLTGEKEVRARVTPTAGVRPMSTCTKRRCATSSRSSA
jgi:hypothetical protein